MRAVMTIIASGLALSGCATTSPSGGGTLGALLGQSVMRGGPLERAIAEADRHPLGSAQNPVRADSPVGQQAYLRRLRCSDGTTPKFRRDGNIGVGAFGNIVDLYAVGCGMGQARAVYMDMYHSGYVERRAVPGFTISG